MKNSDKPVPGKAVSPGRKVDLGGFIGGKSKNLAGAPRSAGIAPASKPSGKGFATINKVRGAKQPLP